MAKSVTNRLASFIVKTSFKDLPMGVVRQTKRHILDYIGVALAGSRHGLSTTLVSLIKDFGGKEESTIIGDGGRVPAPNAALVNGTIGHVLELDDGHRFANAHPGTTVIPAVLALAEPRMKNGKDFIVAVALGYEVMIRIASAINPSHLLRGFHTTGTCGTFGAAAGVAKVLGLNEEKTVNTLGIAGTQAAGLLEVALREPMVKPFQAGRAAQSGVYAALLAEKGVSAPDTILEGQKGFCKATADKCDLKQVAEDLGKEHKIMGSYIKLHAACRHVHAPIDAALRIVKENEITPEDIEKIHVRTYSIAASLTGKEHKPKSVQDAKFNLPYSVAVAIIEGKAGIREFSDEKIKDARVLGLARKVSTVVDPELDRSYAVKRGAIVDITTKSGNKLTCKVDTPKGEPEASLSDEEIENKFRELASTILDLKKTQQVLKLVYELEKVDHISELTKLLHGNR